MKQMKLIVSLKCSKNVLVKNLTALTQLTVLTDRVFKTACLLGPKHRLYIEYRIVHTLQLIDGATNYCYPCLV